MSSASNDSFDGVVMAVFVGEGPGGVGGCVGVGFSSFLSSCVGIAPSRFGALGLCSVGFGAKKLFRLRCEFSFWDESCTLEEVLVFFAAFVGKSSNFLLAWDSVEAAEVGFVRVGI